MQCKKKLILFVFFSFSTIFCQNQSLNNTSATNSNNSNTASKASPGDSSWMIVASILVMVMTPAVGFFYGGLVKTKNMISVLAQTFAIYGITTISWTLIGFTLAFGGSNKGVWGDLTNFALNNVNYDMNPKYGPTIPFLLFFLFQTKFAVISPALIIGATAERVKFLPICIFSLLWSLLVYCPIAHWNWNASGWLNLLGTKDFAGGNVIHISAGVSAMAAVLVIRDEINYHCDDSIQNAELNKEAIYIQQKNKTADNQEIRNSPEPKKNLEDEDSKNSIVFVVIGTMLLWFGWFGFNGGSALMAERSCILAIINTNISPCVTLLVWILLDVIFKGRPTVTGMCIGIVAGLVGITPAAGYVRVWAGIIIGLGSGIFPYIFTTIRDRYKLFDDRLDVFGCHGIAGIWGGFCLGLFLCDIRYDNTCDPEFIGAIYGNGIQLVYQLFGIISTVVYSFIISSLIMYSLKQSMKITVHRNLIEEGLDRVEFRENALDMFKKRRSVLLIRKSNYRKQQLKLISDPEAEKMGFIDINIQTKMDVNIPTKIYLGEEINGYPEEKYLDEMKSNLPNNKAK